MSREEIINDVKRMNEEIINLGDELYWLDWITLGVPDEATEEDFEWYADDLEEYELLKKLFKAIMEEVNEDD
jgi:hypothetical protein